MAGMTMAAVVCGNTVVLKPSVDAPTIAARFFMLLEEIGLPDWRSEPMPGSRDQGFGSAVVEHREDALRRVHRVEGGRP